MIATIEELEAQARAKAAEYVTEMRIHEGGPDGMVSTAFRIAFLMGAAAAMRAANRIEPNPEADQSCAISNCKKCGANVYTEAGFCGSCEPAKL